MGGKKPRARLHPTGGRRRMATAPRIIPPLTTLAPAAPRDPARGGPSPRDVSDGMERPRPEARPARGVEAGGSVRQSYDGIAPAVWPSRGLPSRLSTPLSLRARAAGAAFAADLETPFGTIAV